MMAVVGIWHKTRSTTKERGHKIKMGSAAASTWVIVPRTFSALGKKQRMHAANARARLFIKLFAQLLNCNTQRQMAATWSIIYLFIYASARYSLLFLYCSSFGEAFHRCFNPLMASPRLQQLLQCRFKFAQELSSTILAEYVLKK